MSVLSIIIINGYIIKLACLNSILVFFLLNFYIISISNTALFFLHSVHIMTKLYKAGDSKLQIEEKCPIRPKSDNITCIHFLFFVPFKLIFAEDEKEKSVFSR